jgi:hypothetical protein
MLKRIDIEKIIKEHPNRQFCLHNGYAGFAYGTPSNPHFISEDEALDILISYQKSTGNNPLEELLNDTWFTLMFDDVVPEIMERTGYRMLGFNDPQDCLYGRDGLG